ncbi:MAG: hypothetical protein JJU28_00615 [Cyclobacteriaceae bacterium]|nr:hypothetical protein [Cyclobacteriaceae bacterium]
MLNYFRINDPYRLVIILILVVLLRLPLFLTPDIITYSELKWMVLGQKVAEGGLIYFDIIDDTAPLAAWVYGIIHFIFGRSIQAYSVLAVLLFIVQAGYLNLFLLRFKAYNENNFVPALMYAILGFMAFDIISLSPELMGMTFVLFSVKNLFSHLEARFKSDVYIINAGLNLGVASLFYLPYLIFLPAILLSMLFYTGTVQRRYMLFFYTVSFPFLLLYIYYYWQGYTESLMICFFQSLFRFDYLKPLNFQTLLVLITVPTFVGGISIMRALQAPSYTNFQSRLQGVMLIMLVFSSIGWLLWSNKSGSSLVFFVPMLAFFTAHSILIYRKVLYQELYFTIYILSILFVFYASRFEKFGIEKITDFDKLILDTSGAEFGNLQDNSVLVLGTDLRPLYHGKHVTPYLNWIISSRKFSRLDYYDNLTSIYNNLMAESPDYILDYEDLMPELMHHMPLLSTLYSKRQVMPNYVKYSKAP